MEDDEKTTARAKSGEPVRTTAPAGTPVRRSPPGPAPAHAPSGRTPSDRPVDTLTPPRTVGGRTARLRVADHDEPKKKPRARAPEPDVESPNGPLHSAGHTVGGHTMRLASVDQIPAHEAAAVAGAALHTGPRAPQNGRAEAAPVAAPSHAPSAPRVPSAPSPAPVATRSSAHADDDLSVFASPLAVTVGLVFLAMGSMLTLTVGRRWVLPEPSVAASDLRSPIATQQEAAIAPPKPAAPIATAPAATPAAVATEPPPAATPATTVKPIPQVPRGPSVAPKPTGRRLIFDVPGK